MMSRFPCIHQRAHQPLSFSYSDGSAQKVGGGERANKRKSTEAPGTLTGTGLIMAETQRVIRIDPNGKDTTNTINRAELIGVHAWLKEIMAVAPHVPSTFKLLTDSQVTLQSIQKAIRQPASTWLSTHEPVLVDIVKHLQELTKQGHHIYLGKVKAHMGVRGNIKADKAAKDVVHRKMLEGGGKNDVAEEDLATAEIDVTSAVKNTAHELHQWPIGPMPEQEVTDAKHLQEMEDMLVEGTWPDGDIAHSHEDGPLRAQSQPDPQAADKDEGGGWQIRNLASSLSTALKRSCRLGYSNADSLYVRLWKDVVPMLIPDLSHLFWDQFARSGRRIKTCTVRNTLRLRFGTFWNAKLAKRFRQPYLGRISDANCPLCKQPDSGTHVLGACAHRHLKGLYIERHNEAVAIAGEAIMKGAKGGCLTTLVVDAGWHGKVSGLTEVSRIPPQVLNELPEASLRRMRPDMLIFEKSASDTESLNLDDLQQAVNRRRCKVHIIEVGYCMEVGYISKYQEKHMQHQTLIGHLRDAGYAEVQLHLLIFGNTGGMFHLTAFHLGQLGVPRTTVKDILEKLHYKALKRLEQLVGTRRRLEHEPMNNKRKREQ